MSSQNLKAIGMSLILALAPVLALQLGVLPDYKAHTGVYELGFKLPYLLLGLVALLGFRLNSTRIFFVSLTLILGYALLTSVRFNSVVLLNHENRALVAALALPLSMAAIFALGERRLMSRHGAIKLVAMALPFVLLAAGLRLELGVIQKLVSWQGLSHPANLRLSDTSLLALLGFGASAALFRDRYMQYFSLSSAVALTPVVHALNGITQNQSSRLSVNLTCATAFSAAGLVLLYAIFRLYWQKVYIDELTGVPNRRALDEAMRKLDGTYSMAMVDIDHFKKFNDTYGHEQGDHVLRLVAMHFDRESRHRLYRYGGEEFCLLFDGTCAEEVAEEIDGMRESLATRDFFIRRSNQARRRTTAEDRGKAKDPGVKIRITVSIGLSDSRPNRKREPAAVIHDADQALYAAKRAGRNRVGMI